MNPGYLSFVLALCAAILLASGWKDHFLKQISNRTVFLFFLGWLLGGRLSFRPFDRVEIWGFAVVLLLFSVAALLKAPHWLFRLHLLSLGLFLGSFYFFLYEYFRMAPAAVVFYGQADAVLYSVLPLVFIRLPFFGRFLVFTVGLFAGNLLCQLSLDQNGPVVIGDPAFQDQWWLAACATSLLVLFRSGLARGWQGAVVRWQNRNRKS